MSTRAWAFLCIGLGIATMISFWGGITRVLTTADKARGRVVTQWSSSGSPQEDLMHARRFTHDLAAEAARDPDIEPVQTNLHFASSASRDDVIFVSFLAGDPPDIVDYWPSQLADAVAAGQIRPLDDLVARENRIRERLGLPDFILGLNGGEQAIVRFQANPDDPRIRAWVERGEHAEEAVRLLAMHGKIIGFNPPGKAKALTYNARLFEQAAAAGGAYAELVDAQGRARPPRTWAEMRRFAALITRWGIETYGADSQDRPYGLIMQGQDPNLFARAVDPLAATAGSTGFDFARGAYDYHGAAMRGAFKLLMLIAQDGSLCPGTAQRHYEESRALLSQGRAAMLIDGWHAAMIAAQKNPAAKEQIGSAAIPVPYTDAGEAAELEQMLGFTVDRGAHIRDGGGNSRITCITTGSEYPDSAWDWLYSHWRFPQKQIPMLLEHYNLPDNRTLGYLVFESDDPQWVAVREQLLPFQIQAWNYVETTQVWPAPPSHRRIRDLADHRTQMREVFLTFSEDAAAREDVATFDRLLRRLAQGLEEYTAAVNADLAELVEQGARDPQRFVFPDWDPMRAGSFYIRQINAGDPAGEERITSLRAALPGELRGAQGMSRPPAWPLLLSLTGLILATVAIYLLWRRFVGRSPGGMRGLAGAARRNWHAYVFVAPAVLALFVFVLYPALYQLYLSLHTGTGQTALSFVGLDQYRHAFADDTFWGEVVPNTLQYMTIVAVAEVAVGLGMGCLLNIGLRGIGFYRTLFFIPMVVSMSVVAVIFFGLLSGEGSGLNQALEWIGVYDLLAMLGLRETTAPINWLNDPDVALYTLMGVGVWHGLPYNTILCLAGLQSIPRDLYEAARIDGAGSWQRFTRITLPQLAPILLIILFNSLVGAARHFGNVYILTKGDSGTEIVSTYVFKNGFEWNETALPDVGYAATLSVLYALLLAGFIVINMVYVGRRIRGRYAAAGAGR
ncbi:MAG: ABC transporter permease subunit [Planctomycetota bacterium]